jgi:hypothetical protein
MIDEFTNVSFSTGIYRQSPSYIWLAADKINKELKQVKVTQFVAGLAHRLRDDVRVKLEGFYKDYSNYPAGIIRPYLVLANTGAGYGGAEDNFSTFGLEPLASDGKGLARGVEFSLQKKSSDIPLYGIFSLTYSRSRFTGRDGIERDGKYDQQWLVNLSTGYIFSNNWEVALKFRFATGSPYTPYNPDGTQSVEKYLTKRLSASHSLDLRIDRRWMFEGWSMITYIDVQNVYNKKNVSNISWNYYERKSEMSSGIGILPSIGIDIEF